MTVFPFISNKVNSKENTDLNDQTDLKRKNKTEKGEKREIAENIGIMVAPSFRLL